MKVKIYYFSGTGNSLKVAKDLSNYFDDVELIHIRKENLKESINVDSDIIGIISPVIFSGVPKFVQGFIENMKIQNKDYYIFSVVTYGSKNGMGVAFEQVNKLLVKKGQYLSAAFGIQMPHNMPAKDHVMTEQERKNLFENEMNYIPNIVKAIKEKEVVSFKINPIKGFFEKMTYNGVNSLSKKNPFDKGFKVDDKCISCTRCSKVCPTNNIKMIDGKPKWKLDECQFCFACVQWCPTAAIQYKKSSIGIERYTHPEIKPSELFYK